MDSLDPPMMHSVHLELCSTAVKELNPNRNGENKINDKFEHQPAVQGEPLCILVSDHYQFGNKLIAAALKFLWRGMDLLVTAFLSN